jgi:hypothetical protein
MRLKAELIIALFSIGASALITDEIQPNQADSKPVRKASLASVQEEPSHYIGQAPAYQPTIAVGPSPYINAEKMIVDGARVTEPWLWLLSEARENGWRGMLKGSISGLRSHDEQEHLYHLYLEGKGAPAFAPDGPSRHLEGNVSYLGDWAQAVDVTHARELIYVAGQLGVALHRPYPHEPWHVESKGPFGP